MARLKIKTANAKDQGRKEELLNILSTNDIYVTRIIQANDGFVILTQNEDEMDKIFNNIIDKELQKKNFTPIMPPQLKANRSILIFRVENHIFMHEEKEIKEEIIRRNEWADEVSQVFKFPNSNTLKITFNEAAKATKAQEQGIKMFAMRIASYNIEQDSFHNLITCMRCYQIEDHITKNCPKETTYKICSCCSSNTHTWQECNSEKKTCINCQGDHVTVAMQCPRRKEALNRKRKEAKEAKTITYSSITKQGTQPHTTPIQTTDFYNTQAKTYSCMLFALFLDSANPGTFQEELDNMFEKNNLPKIKITKNPPSNTILGLQNKENEEEKEKDKNENAIEQATTSITKTKEEKKIAEKERSKATKTKTSKTSTKEKEETEEELDSSTETMPDLEQVPAEALGLQLVTKKSSGWPTNLTIQEIIKGIENNTYKWTYTNKEIPEEIMYKMLKNNEIILKNCWGHVDDSSFKKMVNGRIVNTPVTSRTIKTKQPKPK